MTEPEPEPYTCKYCGVEGLYWWPYRGSFRLGDKDMVAHQCLARPDTNIKMD